MGQHMCSIPLRLCLPQAPVPEFCGTRGGSGTGMRGFGPTAEPRG